VYIEGESTALILHSNLSNNAVTNQGAGVYISSGLNEVSFRNSILESNFASGTGSGKLPSTLC